MRDGKTGPEAIHDWLLLVNRLRQLTSLQQRQQTSQLTGKPLEHLTEVKGNCVLTALITRFLLIITTHSHSWPRLCLVQG